MMRLQSFMRLVQMDGRPRRAGALLVALALLGATALVDAHTTLSVEVFYLIPLMIVTWILGGRAGVVWALLSAGVVLGIDLATSTYADPLLPLWNAGVTLTVFLIVTGLIATTARANRDRLQQETGRADLLAHVDALKTDLLQAVSHDVRTPLASIKTSVTILLDSTGTWSLATQHSLLESIDAQCDRMSRLMGQLLDLSRIEEGMLHVDQDWYGIDEVIATAVHHVQARLDAHAVTIDVPPDLPLVPIDFARIEQVVINLLDNAVKYTVPGTPILIRARRQPAAVAVSVIDSGYGVVPADPQLLFTKFAALPVPGQPLGTGLGLAIARGLVEAHGGAITASSPPTGGWCVTFTLPLVARDGTRCPPLEAAHGR